MFNSWYHFKLLISDWLRLCECLIIVTEHDDLDDDLDIPHDVHHHHRLDGLRGKDLGKSYLVVTYTSNENCHFY